MSMVERNPGLAWQHDLEIFPRSTPLKLLAQEPSAFPSGMDFNIWQLFLYSSCQELHAILWKVIERLAKPLELIRVTKVRHYQVLRLMKRVCSEITPSGNAEGASSLMEPFFLAAQNGIHEIVEEILESYPQAMMFGDAVKLSVIHLAVMFRRDKIFKIARQQREQYNASLLQLVDNQGNNILHLAARSREICTAPTKKSKNADYRTPLEVFDEEHRYLVESETQWMIGMATSCTVAASLIATVAFAAAITVPGGNNSNGLPIFSSQKAFLLFVIADALALVTSITTVLSFMSIYTTRYSVNDFLHALPNRLIIGLISLFLSVTSLMVAFGSTMFLVAAQRNSLILVPIIALASVPVALYAYLQLPPLLNMIKSTYGRSIFD
ncbi:UNVERIFIED_CONTAM: hypothetical protein Sangu_1526200 [Sesamum angustifolium]|uniref:PGG domain-containing protein n=1 Tax=Sesamum angustifolium TaxID=2727405 RepID=A0AAW2MSL9_9LAMI